MLLLKLALPSIEKVDNYVKNKFSSNMIIRILTDFVLPLDDPIS